MYADVFRRKGPRSLPGRKLLAISLAAAGLGLVFVPLVSTQVAAASGSGGELVVGISGPLPKLTPVGLQQTDMTYDRLIFEPLVLDGAKGAVLPNLASSWTVSADGKTVVLNLHSGVRFTNGKPFNSSSVVAMLQWAQDPKNPNTQDSQLTLKGDTFTATSPLEVKITTPAPEANSLLNSLVTLPIVELNSNLAVRPNWHRPLQGDQL